MERGRAATAPNGTPFAPRSFLNQISEDDLEELLGLGRLRRFPRRVTLQTEGDRSGPLLIVLSGMAKVSHYTSDGRELIVSLIGPGELVGHPLGREPTAAPGTVVTLMDTQVLTISSDGMATYLEANPRRRDAFINTLVKQLKAAHAERIEMVMNDTTGRLARKLIDLATRCGIDDHPGRVRIPLPLTQQELAAWTGSSREAVSRALQRLRLRGWIEVGRREVTILDLPSLRKRVYFSEATDVSVTCGNHAFMRHAR